VWPWLIDKKESWTMQAHKQGAFEVDGGNFLGKNTFY
jgi:hypothetical protein